MILSPRAGELLIRGGTLVDGTGGPPYLGELIVKDDLISAIGPAGTFDIRDGYEVLEACQWPV